MNMLNANCASFIIIIWLYLKFYSQNIDRENRKRVLSSRLIQLESIFI